MFTGFNPSRRVNTKIPFVQSASQTEKHDFELIVHFIADTDTDEIYFGISFRCRCRHSCSFCSLEGVVRSFPGGPLIGFLWFFVRAQIADFPSKLASLFSPSIWATPHIIDVILFGWFNWVWNMRFHSLQTFLKLCATQSNQQLANELQSQPRPLLAPLKSQTLPKQYGVKLLVLLPTTMRVCS